MEWEGRGLDSGIAVNLTVGDLGQCGPDRVFTGRGMRARRGAGCVPGGCLLGEARDNPDTRVGGQLWRWRSGRWGAIVRGPVVLVIAHGGVLSQPILTVKPGVPGGTASMAGSENQAA